MSSHGDMDWSRTCECGVSYIMFTLFFVLCESFLPIVCGSCWMKSTVAHDVNINLSCCSGKGIAMLLVRVSQDSLLVIGQN